MKEYEILDWVEYAVHDYNTAETLVNQNGYSDIIIYHYHQSLEKIFKGILLKFQDTIPKTHFLDKLLSDISNYYENINEISDEVLYIHKFLPLLRYPSGEKITNSDALQVKKIFHEILSFLKLHFTELYVFEKKLKILMLNYEFPPLGGGASPVSYEIAKGLVGIGPSVTVVTMGYKDLPKYEEIDGIKIYRVKCLRSKKEICHPWEQLSYLLSAKKFLKKHLKNNKYDINHTHFIIPTGYLALWLKKKYKLNYIITSHGSDVLGYNKRFAKLYPFLIKPWKKYIKEAKAVTTPSQFLQNEIKKITTNGNFIVITNGIDPDKFKPMKKENSILIVARLFVNKGIQDILDALKDIDLKDWKVDIVGDGPYKDFLINKCHENGLDEKVTFHGWIDNKSDKMKEFYGKASLFISASYFENLSIVLLEALASGCHVIASNVGGNPEILEIDRLFDKGNVKELKSKILENLMGNKNIPNKLNKKFLSSNVIVEFNRLFQWN